jgi:hypothetical protein
LQPQRERITLNPRALNKILRKEFEEKQKISLYYMVADPTQQISFFGQRPRL